MDNKEKLNQWILRHSKELGLKVSKMTWTNDWPLDVVDYRSSIVVDGKCYEGRGIDRDEETAFHKSLVEAIERSVCDSLNIRSNGVAAHVSLEGAQINAKMELVERDIFLCHYLTNRSIASLEDIGKYKFLTGVQGQLQKHGYELKISKCDMGDDTFVTVEAFSNKNNKFIGLKLSNNEEEAFMGALTECLSNTVALITNREQFSDFGDLKNLEWGPELHGRIYNLGKMIKPLRHLKLSGMKYLKQFDLDCISVENLEVKNELIKSSPIYVVRAKCSLLQNIFYGVPTKEDINFKRLTQMFGRKFSFDEIESFPHPIG